MRRAFVSARNHLGLPALLLLCTCKGPEVQGPSAAASASVAPSAPTALPKALSAPLGRVTKPEKDTREGAYRHPRRVLARIQGDLERIAAGKERLALPEGVEADPLEGFVHAFTSVSQNKPEADADLRAITLEAKKRLLDVIEKAKSETLGKSSIDETDKLVQYAKQVSVVAEGKATDADGLFLRLLATMRLVDATLVLESGDPFANAMYDLYGRSDGGLTRLVEMHRSDIFLRLPCRSFAKHRAAFEAAAKKLDKAAGPLVSCPVAEKHERDWDWMERFDKDPAQGATAMVPNEKPKAEKKPIPEEPKAPSPPWNLDAAVVFMDENLDEAEKQLSAASKKGVVHKLDYMLFLHAFREPSKQRDETIKRLQKEIDKANEAQAKKNDETSLLGDESIGYKPYDGSDESLLGTLRLASELGAANTSPAFYAIPCAILLKKPKLVDATEPLYGGNRDNFLPRSGCAWGRGFVRGFPSDELTVWRNLTEEADGDFYRNHGGTMRFGLAAALNVVEETIRVAPHKLLEPDKAPKMAWPYETWSYMTPESRTIYEQLLKTAKPLKEKLVAQYKKRGMSESDADKAALAGLFQVVWGASCGEAPPPQSLRKLVVDGASADEIRAFIQSGDYQKAESLAPFETCAKTTGQDPLIHVAVRNPASLLPLWEIPSGIENAKDLDLIVDPNAQNQFGKTPLMSAAQQDQVESATLLLEHGASPFQTTYKASTDYDSPPLHNDARTALMYAAARGSLKMIRLLLDAGADKYAADTAGRMPIHYLVGNGPVPANPKLTQEERAEAARLLY